MQIWKEPTYELVDTVEKLDALCVLLKDTISNNKPVCVDIETTGATDYSGLDVYHDWLLGVSFAVNTEGGFYIPLSHTKNGKVLPNQLPISVVRDKLNPIVSTGGVYIGHNIKFDYKFLWRSGIMLYPCFWDTIIALRLLNGDSKQPSGLKKVIKQYVDLPHSKMVKSFADAADGSAAEQDPVEFAVYAIDDVIFTYFLYQGVKPKIDEIHKSLFYDAEAPLTPLLGQMELRGIRIDKDYFLNLRAPLEKARTKIENWFQTKHNTNIASPKQVGELLVEVSDNPGVLLKTKTNAIKTDIEALHTIQRMTPRGSKINRMIKHILYHRGINKALSTYVDKYPAIAHEHYNKDGSSISILHTDFSQIVNSGRLSSSPNVQNITRDGLISIRRGFIARDGYSFIEADWSGCELRLVAIDSADPTMLNAFIQNPRKADLHKVTANGMNVTRHIGKTINFSIIYGATEYSVSKTLNCSKEKAREYLNAWFNLYTGVRDWKKDIESRIKKVGYTETFYGRRRYLSYGLSHTMRERWKWEGGVRELTNHIIQGTSADLLKYSMVKIAKAFAIEGLDAHLITTTHDSIMVEARNDCCERAKEIMKEIMEVTIKGVLLPVDIEIKQNFSKG